MAGVFVALCRSVNIPARLVWVPNHAWAEFYLTDHDGLGHWIPAHTACYSWFGFTGAHELVLQKGDRLIVPQRGRQPRLLDDWMRWSGTKPKVRYVAEINPEPAVAGGEAGPGARRKDEKGEWLLVGKHAQDKYLRR
jgi:transglutaminase-like putative cysteine protease